MKIRELLGSLIGKEEDEIYELLDRLEFLICDLEEAVEQGDF